MSDSTSTPNQTMLGVGRYVKIHSLKSATAKQHNGKTVIIKTPLDDESGRVGVIPAAYNKYNKLLSIKPANLTTLCSCCRMREEVPTIKCDRCLSESYCSQSCKDRHWDGINRGCGVRNCHVAWCVPVKLMDVPPLSEMSDPSQASSCDKLVKYLQLATDAGYCGRSSEQKVMMEKLVAVNQMQPGAFNNLFVSCSKLAKLTEGYKPDEYQKLSFDSIEYLRRAVELVVLGGSIEGGEVDMEKCVLPPGSRIYQMARVLFETIDEGLEFIENEMKGERGEENRKLQNIEGCLRHCIFLYNKANEPAYKIYGVIARCLQKLMKFDDATKCFKKSLATCPPEDTIMRHTALMQYPQCLSGMALYSDESPAKRIEWINEAVTNFNIAIVQLEKDKMEDGGVPEYRAQVQLGRCLFNKHSLMTKFSQGGGVEYTSQQKEELQELFNATLDMAMQGAKSDNDMGEIKEIENIRQENNVYLL